MSARIRKEEIGILIKKLNRVLGTEFGKVKLKSLFSELTFNIIMRMLAGKRYYGEEVSELEEAKKFREIMERAFQLGSYPGDFLPFLKWVDWQYTKRVESLGKDTDWFLQNLVDEHRRNEEEGEKGNTMISHLLCLQKTQPDYYTDEIIKGLIVVSSEFFFLFIMENYCFIRNYFDQHIDGFEILEREKTMNTFFFP